MEASVNSTEWYINNTKRRSPSCAAVEKMRRTMVPDDLATTESQRASVFFDSVDQNHDGVIDRTEFSQVFIDVNALKPFSN